MQTSSIFRHLLLATVVSGLVLPSSSGCLSARGDDDETSSASGDGDGDGDPTTGDGDGDPTAGDGDGDGDSDVTIYDVQQGNVIEGSVIQLNDVIVTSPTELDSMGGAGTLYIQEPGGGEYSGIALYLYSEVAAANSLAPGDVLNITAEYTEYFGLSELVVKGLSDITVTGTDAVPAPAVVNAADVATGGPLAENYEGVLIQVENATADTSDGFGGWFLDSGLLLDLGFLFATGSAPTINAGDSFTSITGPLSFGFDEFRILPRTADDLDGQTLTPPTDATIPEIQQGTFPEDSYVKLTNVVATTGLNFSGDAFFAQDPAGGTFSGIQIYVGTGSSISVAAGDQLTIEGYYEEFFDMSQVDASMGSVTVTGTSPLPAAPVVSPADITTGGALAEDYEGVPVTVENVTVTNADPTMGMSMNVFEVTDGLLIQNAFLDTATEWPMVTNGDTFTSITGPVLYSFNEFKLVPPTAASLVP